MSSAPQLHKVAGLLFLSAFSCTRKPLFAKFLVISISIKFAVIRLDQVDDKCCLRSWELPLVVDLFEQFVARLILLTKLVI